MSKMTKQDKLYCKLMKEWFAEHAEILRNCQENAISARKCAELNDKQVVLHKRVIALGRADYEKWLKQQSKKK